MNEGWNWKPEGFALFKKRMLQALVLILAVTCLGVGCLRLVRAAEATPPQTVPVRQIWVIDGDTLDVLVPREGGPQGSRPSERGDRIRIERIDAPESHQPHCDAERAKGLEAKRAAIRLVRAGREATIVRHGHDRYGRTLGTVAIDGVDLGESLIQLGLALPYAPGPAAKSARIAHWCGPGAW